MVGHASPLRTCVGCRVRAAASELLRVVVDESGGAPSVVPDPRGRLPGRGASLHPVLECLDLAERRRAFPRAFRRAGPLDASPVRAYVTGRAAGRSGSTDGTDSTSTTGETDHTGTTGSTDRSSTTGSPDSMR